MNLFFLHKDPEKAAQLQADVHVIKMILETLQMICTSLHLCHSPLIWPFPLYKCTHKNHPSTKWIRYSVNNYIWALNHGIALCEEYTRRYHKIHKCHEYYVSLKKFPIPHFPPLSISSFDSDKISFNSIPDECEFVALAIADDVFKKCSRFSQNNELLAIETYISYYEYKRNMMKRQLTWYKSLYPPESLFQDISVQKKGERTTTVIGKHKRGFDDGYVDSFSHDLKPKRKRASILRYSYEFS